MLIVVVFAFVFIGIVFFGLKQFYDGDEGILDLLGISFDRPAETSGQVSNNEQPDPDRSAVVTDNSYADQSDDEDLMPGWKERAISSMRDDYPSSSDVVLKTEDESAGVWFDVGGILSEASLAEDELVIHAADLSGDYPMINIRLLSGMNAYDLSLFHRQTAKDFYDSLGEEKEAERIRVTNVANEAFGKYQYYWYKREYTNPVEDYDNTVYAFYIAITDDVTAQIEMSTTVGRGDPGSITDKQAFGYMDRIHVYSNDLEGGE